MILLLLVYFQLYQRTLAVPVQKISANTTNSGTVGWVESPQARGTFDLLISCLTTLSLCAWTAYHPNVHTGTSEFKRLRHRVFWMLAAVLFPEIVLKCAWEQWWAARKLRDELNAFGDAAYSEELAHTIRDPSWSDKAECETCPVEGPSPELSSEGDLRSDHSEQTSRQPPSGEEHQVGPDLPQPSEQSSGNSMLDRPGSRSEVSTKADVERTCQTPKWTMEQASFALSGGFAVDSSTFSPQTLVTFTPIGLKFLAQLGLLPREHAATVADKSKADYMAKILVLIQVGWFLVQCIARLAQKLPLSLLEVHVLAHVFCAFCMYLLWIKKPYDVGCPVLSSNEKVVDIAALWSLDTVAVQSRTGKCGKFHCATTHQIRLSEVCGVHNSFKHVSSTKKYLKQFLHYWGTPDGPKPQRYDFHPSLSEPSPTQQVLEHCERANRALELFKSKNIHFPFISISKKYELNASDGIEHHYIPATSLKMRQEYAVPRRSDLFIEGWKTIQRDADYVDFILVQLKTYTAMSVVYGGLHLGAWSIHFPTSVEQWLWRGSSMTILAAPLIFFAIIMDMKHVKWPRTKGLKLWRRVCMDLAEAVYNFVFGLVFLSGNVCLALYPFARTFLLAEAFSSLRAAPKKTYQTAEWTNFIPHVG